VNGDHPERDDLVAFALGALEAGEERAIGSHVPGCARCTRELEALMPAVGVLGESVEQLEPPPELRERVLAVVRSEAATSEPGETERKKPRRERRGLRAFLLRPAVALATLAVIAAGVGGYLVRDTGGGGGETTVAVQPAQPGIGGSLVVGDDTSTLDLHGMGPVKGGEVYQVWVAEGTSLRPSSDFVPDSSGRAMTAVNGHLSKGTKVMVTKESGPGHTTPTPPILLSGTVE
jgi:anti-sigma-K factor RskA